MERLSEQEAGAELGEGSRPSSPDSDDSDDSFHSTSGKEPDVFQAKSAEDVEGQPVVESDDSPCFTPDPEPLQDENEEEEEEEEDFVDDEFLKDRELNLTEEERTAWREKSMEHKVSGNALFKSGELQAARMEYTAGLRVCPLSCSRERAVLYSNRAAAKAKLDLKKEAIADCSRAIELDEHYTKAVLRRATLSQDTDQLDDALKDFKRVLELEPANREAQEAVRRLPDMINERNEKLKEEMMGKLKDLGNMFLRPFGLSTANFEVKQDGGTGGYNISFNQNPSNT